MELAIYEVLKKVDAEPQDILMVAMRMAFLTLRECTNPDENGNKKERMRDIWNGAFNGLCEDTDTK